MVREQCSPLEPIARLERLPHHLVLGSDVAGNGTLTQELSRRIGSGCGVFSKLEMPVFRNRHLSLRQKAKVLLSHVVPASTFACETWAYVKHDVHRLQMWYNSCVRKVCNMRRRWHNMGQQYLFLLTQ